MYYEQSLFGAMEEDKLEVSEENNTILKLFSWNLQNPSLDRITKQWEYIKKSQANIFIFTEVKRGKAWNYLRELLNGNNLTIYYSKEIEDKDYFTVIAIREYQSEEIKEIKYFSSRVVGVNLFTPTQKISIIGMYAPSGGSYATNAKLQVKKYFHNEFNIFLKNYVANPSNKLIVLGDMNILERNHQPYDYSFNQWHYAYDAFLINNMFDAYRVKSPHVIEHSWISNQGIGQRIDHCFIDNKLKDIFINCYYDHHPRLNKLSDHSAMFLEILNK